jgi:hypothetical protein
MKKFDDIIKSKLEQHEFAYDPSKWESLSNAMSGSASAQPKAPSFRNNLISGIAATTIMSAIMIGAPYISDQKSSAKETLAQSSHDTKAMVSNKSEDSPEANANFEVQKEHDIELIELKKKDNSKATIGQAVAGNTADIDKTNNATVNQVNETIDNDSPVEEPETGDINVAVDFVAKGVQCEGKTVSFQSISDTDGSFQWIIDDVYVLEGESVDFKFNSPGDHTVRMIFRHSNNKSSDVMKQVAIYEKPKVDFLITDEISDNCFNRKVTFKASPDINGHTWNINKDVISKETEFSNLLKSGWYDIALSAVNEEGCVSKVTTSYNVENGTVIFLPSAFSPSKQDDLNDTYLPANLDKMASFSLKITRSSTLKVAYETSELKPWDGSIMNTSEMARTGELFMVEVVATDHCGKTQSFAQQLTIR